MEADDPPHCRWASSNGLNALREKTKVSQEGGIGLQAVAGLRIAAPSLPGAPACPPALQFWGLNQLLKLNLSPCVLIHPFCQFCFSGGLD